MECKLRVEVKGLEEVISCFFILVPPLGKSKGAEGLLDCFRREVSNQRLECLKGELAFIN